MLLAKWRDKLMGGWQQNPVVAVVAVIVILVMGVLVLRNYLPARQGAVAEQPPRKLAFYCEKCQKTFDAEAQAMGPARGMRVKCPTCGTESPRGFKCAECGETFTMKPGAMGKGAQAAGKTGRPAVVCPKCGAEVPD